MSSKKFGIEELMENITVEQVVDALYDYLDYVQESTGSKSATDALEYVSGAVRNLIQHHAFCSCDDENPDFQQIDDFINDNAQKLLVERLIDSGDLIQTDDGQLLAVDNDGE
jgi:uncharacterized protein YktB (UPF0637 family)